MGTGFAKKKKQAKKLQEQFMDMQNKMQTAEFTGTAGNGLVTVILNGEGDIKHLDIKPDCVDPDDVEGLVLLITAAFKDANAKAKAASQQGMPDLGALGGLGGFNF